MNGINLVAKLSIFLVWMYTLPEPLNSRTSPSPPKIADPKPPTLDTSYGAIKEIAVEPNNPVVVDNGHVVAFTSGLSYRLSKVGGLGSAFLGGEGAVLEFNGSGKVYIQSRNMESLATRLIPFMPTARSN